MYASAIADQHFGEDAVFARVVARAGGTALELGSGTGRLLLRLLGAGHSVHGLEISEEMTARCRAAAARQGLSPVVHRGSFAPLDGALSGYAAMYCPLNAFSFVIDDELARASLRGYAAALETGGTLAITGSAGDPAALRATAGWVRRPDVPVDEAHVARVEERRTAEAAGRHLRVERIVELVDAAGTVRARQEGTQLRRLRPMSELAELFDEAGFTDLHAIGDDADHVMTGRKR
ncbi:methyltransferase domain-containing protein [Streptomyces marincola]|uniref:methyltransferase domain-containing protein n=1 Tax=Streptomyces marincola TaxID=2878388 RepID=UPI001CF341D7|nr:methyltransferase domain-containing protein [Streptomyces marincola]UCM88678.1 methyltransferase domain-containing protein [Streptomyces marincola]